MKHFMLDLLPFTYPTFILFAKQTPMNKSLQKYFFKKAVANIALGA